MVLRGRNMSPNSIYHGDEASTTYMTCVYSYVFDIFMKWYEVNANEAIW